MHFVCFFVCCIFTIRMNFKRKKLSIIFFWVGLIFGGWSLISLYSFFRPHGDNRLPPAGTFFEGPESFSFAIMSDSGLRNEPLSKVIRDIRTKNVKFILHLGDQARDLSSNHFEQILQDLDKDLGDTPFYAIPGNHDAIRDQSRMKERSLIYYKRAFGQPNYWFTYGNTLFIAMNTAYSSYPKEDRDWVKTVLKHLRPMFKNCILLMHVPPNDPRPGKNYDMDRDDKKTLKEITKYRITAIFAGHIHEFIKSEWGGIPLYIAPSSGQETRGLSQEFGYILCRITPENNLEVKHIKVPSGNGRDYLRIFLSTELDGITSATISFLSLTLAFIFLWLHLKRKKLLINDDSHE